jgi:hypothetical protein
MFYTPTNEGVQNCNDVHFRWTQAGWKNFQELAWV